MMSEACKRAEACFVLQSANFERAKHIRKNCAPDSEATDWNATAHVDQVSAAEATCAKNLVR
jgi:hypothetical protein